MKRHRKIDVSYFSTRSDLLTQYSAELSQLHETCTHHLSAFAPRLQQAGKALLQRYTAHWQGIDWVQPLVLNEAWSVPLPSRQTLTLANALTTLHTQIQTEAMNNDSWRSTELLPLGSLLYTQALHQYQQLFPPTSHFWRLLEGYYLEWTEATLREQQQKWGAVRRYTQEDILQLAGTRALLKIHGAAVVMLTDNQRVIVPLGSILDHIHIALQLMDGIINWRDDMQARRVTYFLTEVAIDLKVPEMSGLGRLNLERFMITTPLLVKVANKALDHLSAAQKVAGRLDVPALASYIDALETTCRQVSHHLAYDLIDTRGRLGRAAVSASF